MHTVFSAQKMSEFLEIMSVMHKATFLRDELSGIRLRYNHIVHGECRVSRLSIEKVLADSEFDDDKIVLVGNLIGLIKASYVNS